MSQAHEHLAVGDYKGALQVLEGELLRAPSAELFLLSFIVRVRLEDHEGALDALDALGRLEPAASDTLDFLRACVQAEAVHCRRRSDGGLAEARRALSPPQPFQRAYCEAAVFHAQGMFPEAVTALARAAKLAPAVSGTLTRTSGERVRFANLTDSDALTGPHLPCIGGEFLFDVPYSALRSVHFSRPRNSMEAFWVPALLQTVEGGEYEGSVPSWYPGTGLHGSGPVRLGEMTVWHHKPHGYALAFGQRDLQLTYESGGIGLVGILQVAQLEFDPPGEASNPAK